MSIFNILDTCCIPDSKFDRSQDRQQAADTLKNADVPKQQARNASNDFFQDMFKTLEHAGKELEHHWGEFGRNIEGFGQHLQQGWGKFEQDITGLFGPKPNCDGNPDSQPGPLTLQTRDVKLKDPKSKPPSPASSSGSTVRFSDETKATSKDGALFFLDSQKKLIQEKISQSGNLLNTRINQQFQNFGILKNLQSQLLAMEKQIQLLNKYDPSHVKQRRELHNKITEIDNIQRYLALGGEVDKLKDSPICAQYINKTPSRSLNLEEETTLLNKIWMIISKFNAGEGKIAQIKYSSSILEKSVDSFRKAQGKITDPTRRFRYHNLDAPTLKKLAEIQSMSNLLRGNDEQSEVAREYLEKAFNYIVLVKKDNVTMDDYLKRIKTMFNMSDSQLNNTGLQIIRPKAETLRKVFSMQTQTQERIRQSQSG